MKIFLKWLSNWSVVNLKNKKGKQKASHVDTWPISVVFNLTFLFCFLLVSLWFLDKRSSWKRKTGCIWKHSIYTFDWYTFNLLGLLNNLLTFIVMVHLGTNANTIVNVKCNFICLMTPKLLYCEEFIMTFSSQRYCGWHKIVCQSDFVQMAKLTL